MTFTLTISLGNAAMQSREDVAAALAQLAARLSDDGDFQNGDQGNLRDANGNRVGAWKCEAAA